MSVRSAFLRFARRFVSLLRASRASRVACASSVRRFARRVVALVRSACRCARRVGSLGVCVARRMRCSACASVRSCAQRVGALLGVCARRVGASVCRCVCVARCVCLSVRSVRSACAFGALGVSVRYALPYALPYRCACVGACALALRIRCRVCRRVRHGSPTGVGALSGRCVRCRMRSLVVCARRIGALVVCVKVRRVGVSGYRRVSIGWRMRQVAPCVYRFAVSVRLRLRSPCASLCRIAVGR